MACPTCDAYLDPRLKFVIPISEKKYLRLSICKDMKKMLNGQRKFAINISIYIRSSHFALFRGVCRLFYVVNLYMNIRLILYCFAPLCLFL